MVLLLLAIPLAGTGSPNKLILYLKELELLAVKSATASASGGSSCLY